MRGAAQSSMLLLLAVAAAAPSLATDIGPLGCYVGASRAGLDNASSKQLCIGATSAAPALCFANAVAGGVLTQYQAVQLCTYATTDAPVTCVAQLQATTGFTTSYIVGYCAALQWPLLPPPEGGSADCINAAKTTGITDNQSIQLCQGSSSTAPAQCLSRGRDVTGLSDQDLVELCAPAMPYPSTTPTNSPMSPYGGVVPTPRYSP